MRRFQYLISGKEKIVEGSVTFHFYAESLRINRNKFIPSSSVQIINLLNSFLLKEQKIAILLSDRSIQEIICVYKIKLAMNENLYFTVCFDKFQ